MRPLSLDTASVNAGRMAWTSDFNLFVKGQIHLRDPTSKQRDMKFHLNTGPVLWLLARTQMKMRIRSYTFGL